jgi:protein SCO1/2
MSEAAAPAASPTLAAPSGEVRRRRLAIGGIVLGLGLLAMPVAVLLLRPLPPLPVISAVPRFELRDEQGHVFGSDALKGKPYVADFIYTQCHDSCPMLTADMGALQDLLAGDPNAVRLVSFSVDPVHDTPEKLLAYATAARAVPGRWVFLTGPLAEVSSLVEEGFHVPMLGAEGSEDATTHGNYFVVVDAQGRIRGYYPGDAGGRRLIRLALKRLLWGE